MTPGIGILQHPSIGLAFNAFCGRVIVLGVYEGHGELRASAFDIGTRQNVELRVSDLGPEAEPTGYSREAITKLVVDWRDAYASALAQYL